MRHLHNFFLAVLDCVGETFFDDRFEHHQRLMLFEQDELRIEFCFHRKLTQQARAEAMNCSDHGAFERPFVPQPFLPLITGRCAQNFVNIVPDAAAHLVRSAVRKRDSHNVIN